jgi:hypothetical protein
VARYCRPDPAGDPDGTDYELVGTSCWIQVGNLQVYVSKKDEGVSVSIYGVAIDAGALAETWSTFAEGENAPESA